MSSEALWSVKGIDPRARDAAREAARREGLSLGDWLNKVILLDNEDQGRAPERHSADSRSQSPIRRDPFEVAHSSFDARPSEVSSTIHSLDRLAERIETAEARSALAITGIDQSVYALVARLDNAERGQKHYNAKLEGGLRELHATQNAVADRLRRMEEDSAASQEDLAALRRLETALSTLAARVRDVEENAPDKDQIDAKLEAVAEQVDLASREMQRVSARADDAVLAAGEIKHEVTGTVKDLAERLTQAETATDAAVRGLHATVQDLGERLAQAEARGGEHDASLSSVTEAVTRMIDAGREEVAREIAAAFAMLKPGETESALTDLQARLAAAERRQLASFERIGSEIDRLAQSLDQRLRTVEERNSGEGGDVAVVREEMARVVEALDRRVQAVADRDMAAIQRMGEEMARFAGVVDERVSNSERMTAEAITQVGAQIEGVATRLQERQQNAIDDLMDKMREQDAAAGERLDAALSNVSSRVDAALSNVSERLDNVERNAGDSPLHTALEALSERLRAVEGAAPKALPKSFEGPSAANSTAPRVSGWGMYDATPAAAPVEAATWGVFDADFSEDLIEEVEGEAVILPSAAEDHCALDAEEGAGELEIIDAEELFLPAFEVPILKDPEPTWDIDAKSKALAIDQTDEGVDELAALIEMLDAASAEHGAAPVQKVSADIEELDDVAEDFEGDGGSAVIDEPDVLELSALNFTRPEPASEILCGAQDEDELTLTNPDVVYADRSLSPDDVLDLDPELAEAIFGVPRPENTKPTITNSEIEAPLAAVETEEEPLALTDSFESALVEETRKAAAQETAPEAAAPMQPVDYLQQARMAALANQQLIKKRPARNRAAPAPVPAPQSSGQLTRTHILTAAGVAAVAAIGAGTYFGKKLDPETLEQTLSQSAPRPAAAKAEIAPAVVAPPPAAALDGSDDLSALSAEPMLPPSSSQPAERFPEAAPTIAPRMTDAPKVAMAEPRAVRPSAAAASPAEAAPLYQRAVEALRGGDAVAGAKMMLQAADMGYAPAQYRLSKVYERGEGVAKNMGEARRWTEKSAKSGNRKAMHDLAVYYAEGEGVRQDYVSAVEWFRKAADYGLSDSQYNLGVLYEQGLGVSQDEGEALYWFEIAGRAGDQDAARRAREIESSAPPAVVTSALRRADVYKPRPLDPLANGDSARRSNTTASIASQ